MSATSHTDTKMIPFSKSIAAKRLVRLLFIMFMLFTWQCTPANADEHSDPDQSVIDGEIVEKTYSGAQEP